MGKVFSRFRKQNTKDQLETIEKDIKSIHEFRVNTQQRQKRLVGAFIFYSVVFYIIGAVAFYFYYFPNELSAQLLYSLPLLIFPVLVWLLKEGLHWYFRTKLHNNESKLTELLRKKRKILEEVMETETYKVARELLEKYDPDQLKKKGGSVQDILANVAEPELRQRLASAQTPGRFNPNMKGPLKPPLSAQGARIPIKPGTPQMGPGMMPMDRLGQTPAGMQIPRPPGPPMPRPILPRERTVVDKMIEYLVGDGPGSRYALICRQCQSHNGMALKEEFEYMAFRCCYCYYWNPARKHRPAAPRLPEQQFSPIEAHRRQIREQDAAEESGSSEGETESEEMSEPSEDKQHHPGDDSEAKSEKTSPAVSHAASVDSLHSADSKSSLTRRKLIPQTESPANQLPASGSAGFAVEEDSVVSAPDSKEEEEGGVEEECDGGEEEVKKGSGGRGEVEATTQ